MARLGTRLALGLCAAAVFGCAHAAPSAAAPEAPEASAAATPAAEDKAPDTILKVSGTPIEALRSPYFAALELTFENPSSAWHEVRRAAISPERQLYGPPLEPLEGPRLRAWQLAARDAHQSKDGPPHIALETLASDAPASGDATKDAPGGAPPEHLFGGAF